MENKSLELLNKVKEQKAKQKRMRDKNVKKDKKDSAKFSRVNFNG